MDFSTGMIALCFVICFGIIVYCEQKKNQGIIIGGAQMVVTVGVLFTFVGIAYSLYYFDTNANNITNSINEFIGGMKTAFWTSIIGMISGIIIKLIQSGVEQKEDESVKESLSAINLTKNAVNNNTTTLLAALNNIKASLDANSTTSFQREVSRLVTTMETFVESSNESRTYMKKLSESMDKQSDMLQTLSYSLTKSIADFGENQRENLKDLSDKIITSGNEQSKRLDAMNVTIDKMLTATETAQKNSQELLDETKNYQTQSLANDDTQMKILSNNTEQIIAMKKSFDKFLQDVAESFSKQFIAALTQSIQDLNNQLQTQFGENFKELNSAVKEVVTWQREYKDIVTKTTEELKVINETFNREVMDALSNALIIFDDTANKNVAVQKNLNDAIVELSDAVEQSKAAVVQMQAMTESFGQFSKDVLNANTAALEQYRGTVKENLSKLTASLETLEKEHHEQVKSTVEDFGEEVKKLQNTAGTVRNDTENYLRQFNEVSGDAISGIRKTLETFDKDLGNETKDAVKDLKKLFAEANTNIKNQIEAESEKSVKSLAAALVAINNQMISNYNALIDRIAKLDKIIKEGGNKS